MGGGDGCALLCSQMEQHETSASFPCMSVCPTLFWRETKFSPRRCVAWIGVWPESHVLETSWTTKKKTWACHAEMLVTNAMMGQHLRHPLDQKSSVRNVNDKQWTPWMNILTVCWENVHSVSICMLNCLLALKIWCHPKLGCSNVTPKHNFVCEQKAAVIHFCAHDKLAKLCDGVRRLVSTNGCWLVSSEAVSCTVWQTHFHSLVHVWVCPERERFWRITHASEGEQWQHPETLTKGSPQIFYVFDI